MRDTTSGPVAVLESAETVRGIRERCSEPWWRWLGSLIHETPVPGGRPLTASSPARHVRLLSYGEP